MDFSIILMIFIFLMGFLENYFHQKRIKQIPIRIHVNGTRGKSTTVRLISASLREAGYQVLAKTTGTTPRIILKNGQEETIKRRGTANIIEQKTFIKKAVQNGCNAVVLECMAVQPESLWVSEHRMIKSTIGVITNVREDHQDVYGPDLKDAAEALKLTIPKNGYLITVEDRFFPVFKQQAEKLNTKSILVNPEKMTAKELIRESESFYFQDNVAITLKISQLLGIKKEIALRGIAKAKPDPGALTIHRLKKKNKVIWFINAFAANDRESILIIWDKVNTFLPEEMNKSPKIAIINHRDDRITRTIQFDKLITQDINIQYTILVGPTSQLSQRKLIQFGYPPGRITLIKNNETTPQIIDKIFQCIEEKGIVFGLGNTRGFGLELMNYFKEKGEKI